MAQVDPVLFGLTGKGFKNWIEWKRQNDAKGLPPDGVASLAAAAPHQPYVTAVQDRIESLLALCTKSREEMLGPKPAAEEQELSRKELFQKRLEEELAQLRQALASVPAAAPAASAPPPAGP